TVRVQASSGSMLAGAARRAATQTVELSPGGTQQVDVTFSSDVVVSGRVTRNGVPVASGTVSFFPRAGNSRASGSSSTDNDGMYSIRGLEEGEYSVMVSDAQRMSPYQTTYQVRGTTTYDIDYKTASLRGRVLDVSTNEPLSNVSVTVRAANPTEGPRSMRVAVTDVTGAFILDSVPPGSYVLTASKDGFGNDVKDVYVGDSAPADLELHLANNLGVTLNVVDARDQRPIGARAIAFDMAGRVVDETRMMFGSSESASLKLSLSPGNYMATVVAEGYAPRSISFQSPSTQTVMMSPGGTLEVRSQHNNAMRVRLIDANGQPYPRFGGFPPTRELLPSPGTTTLSNIAAGVYTLQLLNGEAVVDSKRVVVVEGQTVREEI
ncbi:MAG TPA: carboxypeptidase-like regulatory domain-containing protein, partial [Thermoanaerobaculia bacterium]